MTSIGTVNFLSTRIPCCHSPFGPRAFWLDYLAVSLAQNPGAVFIPRSKAKLTARDPSQRRLSGVQPNIRANIKGNDKNNMCTSTRTVRNQSLTERCFEYNLRFFWTCLKLKTNQNYQYLEYKPHN